MALYLRPFSRVGGHLYSSSFTTVNFIPKCSHIQFLHTGFCFENSSKLQLSNLRKKTGFPISHCKKALELYEGDIEKAEEWLNKEAQAHGWSKATKLSGRATKQGLIAVCIKKNVGCLVEVNCETDFVAKNADFQALVTKVAEELAVSATPVANQLEHPVKELIDKEGLSAIKTSDGNLLSDAVALAIGKLGENIQLRRGVKFVCPPNMDLVGYAHPSPPKDANLLGRYGAVVAFKNTSNGDVVRELCAHIVGMNPQNIGSLDDIKEENELADQEPVQDEKEAAAEQEGDEEENEGAKHERKPESPTLVRQAFLSDPEMTVGQVLTQNDIQIIDFVRLECGEAVQMEN